MAHILLVEDDVDLRSELREFMQRRRYSVRDCGTLAEAAEALGERQPDVVVCDINLPDGNGAQFCAAQATRNARTQWLLMSGDADAVRQSRQLKRPPGAPPVSVLSKPVPMRMLDDFLRLADMQRQAQLAR